MAERIEKNGTGNFSERQAGFITAKKDVTVRLKDGTEIELKEGEKFYRRRDGTFVLFGRNLLQRQKQK